MKSNTLVLLRNEREGRKLEDAHAHEELHDQQPQHEPHAAIDDALQQPVGAFCASSSSRRSPWLSAGRWRRQSWIRRGRLGQHLGVVRRLGHAVRATGAGDPSAPASTFPGRAWPCSTGPGPGPTPAQTLRCCSKVFCSSTSWGSISTWKRREVWNRPHQHHARERFP